MAALRDLTRTDATAPAALLFFLLLPLALLVAGLLMAQELGAMRTLAIRAPAIILGGLGFSGGVSSIVRRTRRRRADARVLRVCLLQLVSVAETLTDLSYAERVITDITLKDARTFDVIGVQALH